MNLKNRFAALFIIFILFAAPVLSKGVPEQKTAKLNTEIYEIDYRGPETHSYRPPPDRSSHGNTNGDPKVHGGSRTRRPATEYARKKVKKLRG